MQTVEHLEAEVVEMFFIFLQHANEFNLVQIDFIKRERASVLRLY